MTTAPLPTACILASDPIRPTGRPPLSAEQVQHFINEGFVKVPSLLEPAVVDNLRQSFTDELGLVYDNPATWSDDLAGNLGEKGHRVDLSALNRPQIRDVAHALAGPHVRVGGGTPIIRHPATAAASPAFEPGGFHLDGVRQGLTLYPTRRYLVAMVYLTPCTVFGGGTSLRPGSHRQVFEYAYRTGCDLSADCRATGNRSAPDLPYRAPVTCEMEAGDAIFFHYLLAHGGSTNHSQHLRIGINIAFPADRDHPYQPKQGPPQPDWTPIDWTLRTDNLA